MTMLGELAADLLILAAMTALGVLVLRVLNISLSRPLSLSLGFGIGAGVLTFGLFLISWAGIALNGLSICVVYLVLAGTAIACSWFSTKSSSRPRPERVPVFGVDRTAGIIAWTVIGALFLLLAILSVGLAYHSWDGISLWGVKGYGIALRGDIRAAEVWGNAGISFPLNVPLQIATFRLLSGDGLPGSKLLFPLIYLSLLISFGTLLIRLGVGRIATWAMTLLIATTPIFLELARIAHTDLLMTNYAVAGFLVGLQELPSPKHGLAWLSGILLALCAWTRPDGVAYALTLATILIVMTRKPGRKHLVAAHFLLPTLVVSLAWTGFLIGNYTGNEEFNSLRAALSATMAGHIRPETFVPILRFIGGQVIFRRRYGVLLAVTGLVGIGGFAAMRIRIQRNFLALLVGVVSTGLITCLIYYTFAFAPSGGTYLDFMISRALDRSLVTTAVLAAALTAVVLSAATVADDNLIRNDDSRRVAGG